MKRIIYSLLIASSLLSAKEPMRFGLSGSLLKPAGAVGESHRLDGEVGFGVGALVSSDLGNGHGLRLHADIFEAKRDENPEDRYEMVLAQCILDYVFHIDKTQEGAYLLGGLGWRQVKRKRTDTQKGIGYAEGDDSGLAYEVGAGYAFNQHFSLEAKYTGMRLGAFDYDGYQTYRVEDGYAANFLALTAAFTF